MILNDLHNTPCEMLLKEIRRDILIMAEHSSHVAAALSCVEIIAALYSGVLRIDPNSPSDCDRDYFILSKGHGCMALYSVLAHFGFIDRDLLKTYSANGSCLAEHPMACNICGIEFATGSLGHGLAVAAGIAKAFKLLSKNFKAFVLLGDGECDEGSIWESVTAASVHCLDNLTAIVDWNGLQASGPCCEVSKGIYLPDCWRAFGWQVVEADGHDFQKLRHILIADNQTSKPRVVFCRTVKGKGISFMENDLEWHYRPVKGQEKENALRMIEDA